jgi:hypothetical protein
MQAPDVKHTAREASDEYLGTAEALIAAGLIAPEQLPGAEGLPRTIVRLRPDGSIVGSALQAKAAARLPDSKLIERRGRQFAVTVQGTAEQRVQRRRAAIRLVWSA